MFSWAKKIFIYIQVNLLYRFISKYNLLIHLTCFKVSILFVLVSLGKCFLRNKHNEKTKSNAKWINISSFTQKSKGSIDDGDVLDRKKDDISRLKSIFSTNIFLDLSCSLKSFCVLCKDAQLIGLSTLSSVFIYEKCSDFRCNLSSCLRMISKVSTQFIRKRRKNWLD